MACDFRIPEGMTLPQRKKQIDQALERLRAALADGTVKVKVGPTGAVAFVGDWNRDGVMDGCAYRKLSAMKSPELARAVAKAEIAAGRKVDAGQVAAGVHSHDGKTWSKH